MLIYYLSWMRAHVIKEKNQCREYYNCGDKCNIALQRFGAFRMLLAISLIYMKLRAICTAFTYAGVNV